jgi:hypothetical protein
VAIYINIWPLIWLGALGLAIWGLVSFVCYGGVC